MRFGSVQGVRRATSRWFRERFTPAGGLVLVALTVAAFLGMDTNLSMAYQVFSFLAALVVVSFLTGLANRPGFEARRILPETATAGQRIFYRLVVRNKTTKRLSAIVVAEDGAAASIIPPLHIPDLAPLGESEIQEEITALQRGKWLLTGLTFLTPHPLGLTRSPQRFAAHDSVLVLPRRYPTPPVHLAGTRKYQPGGVTLSSSIGESLEFESLRDYRPGDPLRRIHWRSWAKTGKLVVKEFQDEYFVRHALLLDTFPTQDNAAVFEEAVSVAASFACSVLTQDSLLDLLFVGAETYRFTAGRGLGGPERMLEVLACVSPCAEKSFEALAASVLSGCSALSGCICVLLAWDEPRQALIRNLEALRVPVLACVIVDPARGRPPQPPSPNIHLLELGKIAEGLAKL